MLEGVSGLDEGTEGAGSLDGVAGLDETTVGVGSLEEITGAAGAVEDVSSAEDVAGTTEGVCSLEMVDDSTLLIGILSVDDTLLFELSLAGPSVEAPQATRANNIAKVKKIAINFFMVILIAFLFLCNTTVLFT